MTTETSDGKAGTVLPRSGDLATVPAPDPQRAAQRDVEGRFATGNVVGRGKGWKRAVAKMLGRVAEDPVAAAVAADAWKLYSAKIRELPNDGATARGLAALGARADALAAFWHTQAALLGLTTPEGKDADDRAMRWGQRAERLAVTAVDVSTKLAVAARARPSTGDALTKWMGTHGTKGSEK